LNYKPGINQENSRQILLHGFLKNQNPFNANDAEETNNANFYLFREIRPRCAIRVEIATPNQQSVKLS
jgi:hypothetical protein